MFYVAIDFILNVFLYNFAFFVCEKLTTKNEKRTFGYFLLDVSLALNVYLPLCVFSLSLSPSLSFAACLQHTLVLEMIITDQATVFSLDTLRDVIVRGNSFASPIT